MQNNQYYYPFIFFYSIRTFCIYLYTYILIASSGDISLYIHTCTLRELQKAAANNNNSDNENE